MAIRFFLLLKGWPERDKAKEGVQAAADTAGHAYDKARDTAQAGVEVVGEQGTSMRRWGHWDGAAQPCLNAMAGRGKRAGGGLYEAANGIRMEMGMDGEKDEVSCRRDVHPCPGQSSGGCTGCRPDDRPGL